MNCKRMGIMSAILTVTLGGCLLSPPRKFEAPQIPLPSLFVTSGEGEHSRQWWKDFNDTELDAAVERALGNNFDITIARARLQASEALTRQAGAPRWPGLSTDINSSNSSSLNPFTGELSDTTRFGASLQASFEIDIWGKWDAAQMAAERDEQAARATLKATEISLIAEVVSTYLSLTVAKERVGLVRQQLDATSTFRDLVEARYAQGLTNAFDVYQLRQQEAQIRSTLESANLAKKNFARRLTLLQGEVPVAETQVNSEVPEPLPPLPTTGVPSSIILNRPDVLAATWRLAAGDARVAQALANRFPSLRLSAGLNLSATTIADLFKEVFHSLTGSLSQPLFQGGALVAAQKVSEARRAELEANLRKVATQAVMEIDSALDDDASNFEQTAHINQQLQLARASYEDARERYLNGLSDFLSVLTSLRSTQQVELQSLSQRESQILSRIKVYRVLGGYSPLNAQSLSPSDSQ